jgi:hypothetical protein
MGTRQLLTRIEALERRLSARTTQLILALDQIAQLKQALNEHNLEIIYGNEPSNPEVATRTVAPEQP